jgi:Pyruvate phosphate dikinase, AMP/ATP-binding domain
VDAQVPLVMTLEDPGATPGIVGGKGASLARLARAAFRVPPGFHVTTSAYLDFIGRGGLREQMLAAMSAVDVSDAATFGAAAARVGELFAAQPVPARDADTPPRSSPTSARPCPTPRSWPANWASPPSSDAATPPYSCTAATGSGSTAAAAPSSYSPGTDITAMIASPRATGSAADMTWMPRRNGLAGPGLGRDRRPGGTPR